MHTVLKNGRKLASAGLQSADSRGHAGLLDRKILPANYQIELINPHQVAKPGGGFFVAPISSRLSFSFSLDSFIQPKARRTNELDKIRTSVRGDCAAICTPLTSPKTM